MSKNSILLKFKPANLSKGKEWMVVYYVVNPATELLHRKKIKLNHIKDLSERKKFAQLLIKEINAKLYSGWNPFLEENAARGFTKIEKAIDLFFRSKEKELRDDSIRSYKSYLEIFKKWLKEVGKENAYCVDFKKIDALDFLDFVYFERKLSSRTFNNYRLFFSTLWNWLQSHQYVSSNVFETIKKKQTTGKERIIIDHETRDLVKSYLEKNDYNFLIVAMLVFHTLIRPKEICNLKPNDFKLKRQLIHIRAEVSKNKSERFVTIPNELMKYLVSWDFNQAKNDEYIFGTNLVPGRTPVDARRFTKKWDKLRLELCLDEKMKLYSLRDSGIIQLLQDGVSPEEVMKQADHSSLDITTIYVKYANLEGSEQIRKKSSKF